MRVCSKSTGSTLWEGFLDLVYPGMCRGCGDGIKSQRAFCVRCSDWIASLRAPFCRTCGEEFDGQVDGEFDCPNCKGLKFSFEFARPAVPNNLAVLDLIHQLKYLRKIDLAEELAHIAERAFREDPRFEEVLDQRWPLVPVPLHQRRQRWRHFNQAEEIVRPLAGLTDLPVCNALRRDRSTGSQTRLTRSQRLKNLKGAFALTEGGQQLASEHPGGVVLVDDVFTTGATSDECASVLRKGGVQKVVVVTVMRG